MDIRDFRKEIDFQGNVLHSLMTITYGLQRLLEALEDHCAEVSLSLNSDDGGCDHDL